MKIALAQLRVEPGNPSRNVAKMKEFIAEAASRGLDLVAFPEMAVGGYMLGDLYLVDEYCRELMSYNNDLQQAAKKRGIAVAYGNVYLDPEGEIASRYKAYFGNNKTNATFRGKDGRDRRYNAAYVFDSNGQPARRPAGAAPLFPDGIVVKTNLPNYRFFDDQRYFFSLADAAEETGLKIDSLVHPLIVGDEAIGFELCEDMWCEDYRSDFKARNVTQLLISRGATAIVNLSSSPWTYGKHDARDRRVKANLNSPRGDAGVPFYYINVCGVQNNGKDVVTFDGGSTIYNGRAERVVCANTDYREQLIFADTDEIPLLVAANRPQRTKTHEKFLAIMEGLRTQRKYLVPLSGGVDSAVAAALCVAAVGSENVYAVNMPTQYNSARTRDAAASIAEKLKIAYAVAPIENVVDSNTKILDVAASQMRVNIGEWSSVVHENIAAKIRGASVASNLAQILGARWCNCGNKTEVWTVYATLYGDWGGSISPLGDLTKAEVFDMARFLNNEVFRQEIIPESLLPDQNFQFTGDKIAPSAELKDAQIDPMKFGYHCALIDALMDYRKKGPSDILRWWLDGTLHSNLRLSLDVIRLYGLDDAQTFVDDLHWFCARDWEGVFKRVQSVPVIVTSKTAYGYDRRESIIYSRFEWTREAKGLVDLVLKQCSYAPKLAN